MLLIAIANHISLFRFAAGQLNSKLTISGRALVLTLVLCA